MTDGSERKTVVGIDLGTTMSAISFLDDEGVVVTVPSSGGGFLTPSAVLIGENEIFIGNSALENASQFPNMFAECFKRNIGQSHYPVKIKDYNIPPEVLCALLIEHMKSEAEEYLGRAVHDAVITVPAFYGSQRRQSTRLAGELAGLTIMDVVNEPTAAAIAYGLETHVRLLGAQTVLVYDLGGGTFDVSVLKVGGGSVEVLASSGDLPPHRTC